MNGQRGFTLVESLVALVIFLFGVALATQLLLETAVRFRDGYARDLETPVSLVGARLRADLEAARGAACLRDAEGEAVGLRAFGHPSGTLIYQLEEGVLWRFVESAPEARTRVLNGLTGLACGNSGGLFGVELQGRRRALRRSPLTGSPNSLQPTTEPWQETLWVAPRGAGRAEGW